MMADHSEGLQRLRFAWARGTPEDRRTFFLEQLKAQGLEGEGVIEITSQVGSRDFRPYVVFKWNDKIWRLPTDAAMRHAVSILEVATGASADAFLSQYVMKTIGADEVVAATLMQEFRTWREAESRRQATEREDDDAR